MSQTGNNSGQHGTDQKPSLFECYRCCSPNERKGFNVAAVVMILAGLGNGYNLSCLDVDVLNLPPSMVGLITSSPMIGVTASSILCGWTADTYGRARASIFGEVVLVIGIVLSATSQDLYMLQVGQMILGLGVGFCSVAKPLYVSEKCPGWARAVLMSAWTIFVCIGIMCAYMTRYIFTVNWRAQIICGLPPGVIMIFIFGIGWASETEIWEEQRDKRLEAESANALTDVLKPDDDTDGFAGLAAVDEEQAVGLSSQVAAIPSRKAAQSSSTCEKVQERSFVEGCIASLFLAVLAATPGYVMVMADIGLTFRSIGFATSSGKELAMAMAVGSASLVGICIATPLIDWLGTRTMQIGATISCIACLAAVGAAVHFHSSTGAFVFIVMYMVSFNFGPINIFWVLIPELFSNRHRALGISVAVTLMHGIMSAVSFSYSPVIRSFGFAEVCFAWVVLNTVFLVAYILFVTPERFPLTLPRSELD